MTAIQELLEKLKSKPRFEALLAIWRRHNPEVWKENLEVYQLLGHQLVKNDHPLLALDVFTAGLKHTPKHQRLRELQGLAKHAKKVETTSRASIGPSAPRSVP